MVRRISLYSTGERSVFLTFFYQFVYYFKTLLFRLNYFIVVILCLCMLSNSKKSNSFANYIKPKILFLSKPQIFFVKVINFLFIFIRDNKVLFSSLQKENELLKKENLRNRQKLLQYEKILYENNILRKLLNFLRNTTSIYKYRIVQLSILNDDIFSKRILVSFGKKYGINDGDLVIDRFGNLVGKIINVKDNTSEILLLTDIYARFVSVSEKSRLHFISSGYGNNSLLDIIYEKEQNFNLNENETVYVNFKDDINFPIGKVVKIKNKFKIKPNVKFNQLDYAIVVIR